MFFEEAYRSWCEQLLSQEEAALILRGSDRSFRRYSNRYEESDPFWAEPNLISSLYCLDNRQHLTFYLSSHHHGTATTLLCNLNTSFPPCTITPCSAWGWSSIKASRLAASAMVGRAAILTSSGRTRRPCSITKSTSRLVEVRQ